MHSSIVNISPELNGLNYCYITLIILFNIAIQLLSSIAIKGPRGVMVIAVGNGHGNTSSNAGRDWLHFT